MTSPWTVGQMPSQGGKRAIVTGVGGIGFETARALARAGAEVTVAGRDAGKGREAVGFIRKELPDANVGFALLDLASLRSIEQFAAALQSKGARIDILVNNAGVMMPPKRLTTADGFELQFGTNHLGHFALTGRLMPLLMAAKAARVVTLSSGAHKGAQIDFDDLQAERNYKAYKQYGQSKLANILFARELQHRQGANLTSVAVHPGYARTQLVATGPGSLGPFGIFSWLLDLVGQDAAGGALPSLLAATAVPIDPLAYYGPKYEVRGPPAVARPAPAALDRSVGSKLWGVSERLTGVAYSSALR